MLSQLGQQELARRLAGPGLNLVTGPFTYRIHSPLSEVADVVALHYSAHQAPSVEEAPFADFHIRVAKPAGIRRWIRPQVEFWLDDERPFFPVQGDQAYPLLEWGMNWCITTTCHHYITIHAGVLERHGRVLVMPAPPGSGKSTLTAALSLRGWRLFSDELALLEPETGLIQSMTRPVSLKNQSIAVIRAFEPSAVLNPPVHETSKGTVAHLRPNRESVLHTAQRVLPGWMVLPRYEANSKTSLTLLPKAEAVIALIQNSFNHSVFDEIAFHAIADLVQRSDCYRFTYSNLDEAVDVFNSLTPPQPESVSRTSQEQRG